jgi:hypothetical protein
MRRRLIQLGLFVLAGAIINVAVAWGCCVLRIQTQPAGDSDLGYMAIEVSPERAKRPTNSGAMFLDPGDRLRLVAQGWQPSADPWWHSQGIRSRAQPSFGLAAYDERFLGASWRRFTETKIHGCFFFEHECATQARAGLPVASLFGQRIDVAPPATRFGDYRRPAAAAQWMDSGVFLLKAKDHRGQARDMLLPYAPLWPGFAINTVFYAGILWLLFAAPFALRRRRRIKRGLCPACAYPVGDSEVCTECGQPVRGKI